MLLHQANDQLRFALNELKAMEQGSQLHSDRATCARRLRMLADYLEEPNTPPLQVAVIIEEAHTLPVQM